MANENRIGRMDHSRWALVCPRREKIRRALAAAAFAVVGTSAWVNSASAVAATFTYSPLAGTTDSWSAGTNWTAIPVSAVDARLTFSDNATTFIDTFQNINTNDINNAGNPFQLNILDLRGTGPATGSASISINNLAPGVGLQLAGTAPVVNLTAVGTLLTYNINQPVSLATNTTFTGAGTAVFKFNSGINTGTTTLTKTGSSVLSLGGASTIKNLIMSSAGTTPINHGTIAALPGSTFSIGAGATDTIRISQIVTNNTVNVATFDTSAAASVTANTGIIRVGEGNNNQGSAQGFWFLGASNDITASTEFDIGYSTNTVNLVESLVTTPAASTTSLKTPLFQINARKTIGRITTGSASTFNLGTLTGRTNMRVCFNDLGGGNNYAGTADFSGGVNNDAIFNGFLSSITVGNVTAGSPNGINEGSLILSNSASNHLDMSGASTANGGVFVVGRNISGGTGSGRGNVTIGNLDATSTIVSTDNGTGIAVAVKTGAGGALGTLNLNGGTLTVTTTGAAILGGAGTSTVNFNGLTLKSGNNSSNWVNGLTNARIGDNGAKFDTNSFAATVPQNFVAGGTGGITKFGAGTLTLSGTSTYTGQTKVSGGVLSLAGSLTSNINVDSGAKLAGAGSTSGALTFNGSGELFVTPTGLFLQANTVNASGATVLITPTTSLPVTPTVILNAPGGMTGAINTNFVLDSRAVLSMNGGTQLLIAASGSDVITWVGNNSGTWDVHTTPNWKNLGAPDVYFNPDKVNFDDSAATFSVSIVPGGVSPGVVNFSNSANDYTIQGGAIAGNASVTFSGSRTVFIQNNNTFAGGTTINAGTVQIGDGTSSVGALGTGSITNNAALVTNFGAAGGTLPNNISGSGSLSKIGAGTLMVSGSNTYSGGTNINAGTLQLPAGGSLGSGSVLNNAALTTTGTTILPNNISGTGSIAHTGGTLTLIGNVTIAGNTTVSPGATLSIGNNTITGSVAGPIINDGTVLLNRSDDQTVSTPISGTGLLSKRNVNTATLSNASIPVRSIEVGNGSNAGTVVLTAGTVSLGDGSGALNVGVAPGASNGTGVFNALGVASFTANFNTINVGVNANSGGISGEKVILPANNSITAATSFLIGDSGGTRNQDSPAKDPAIANNIQVTIDAGGTTTVRTPVFSVGRSKTSSSLILGAGSTFDIAGTGVTPRTLMGVGNMQTGGGAGDYYELADFSSGIFKGFLSGLQVGNQANNAGATSSNLNATMLLSNNAANHLDVSGVATGPTPSLTGLVTVGVSQDAGNIALGSIATSVGVASGTLTIGNLDGTSSITVTDGIGGIGSGNAILVGAAPPEAPPKIYGLGWVDFNGTGTLTITTTGSAIAGPAAGTAGIAFVNFNGLTLKAGASSNAWIKDILINSAGGPQSGAFIGDGGLKIDTNGFAVTVPQQFVPSGNGGITKHGGGTLTLTANNNYNGTTTITGGALVVNNAADDVIFNNAGADIQNGRLVFDYNGGSDPIADVYAALDAGFDQTPAKFSSGDIRSSTATANIGLGYIDDTTAGRVTVARTYFGDANLDGAVNALDFNALATNFGLGGAWVQGDFNYDGTVNGLDFTAIAGNFNQTMPLPAPIAVAGLGALVPEPGCVAMLAMTGLVLRRRARSR